MWLAIESILDQTFKDFEFIILDDWSTDRSYEICKNYAKKDNRIRLYKNEKNQWLSYTRNRLIGLATTDYIASQDSDDISVKSRLEIEYQFLSKNSKYSVVWWANEIIDEDWKNVWYRTYSDNILNIILKKSPISNPSSMYKKSDFYKKALSYFPEAPACSFQVLPQDRCLSTSLRLRSWDSHRVRLWVRISCSASAEGCPRDLGTIPDLYSYRAWETARR